MSILTKQQLEDLNQSSFPDNSAEAITPAILRTYNTATIDTLVDSLDTGSFITENELAYASGSFLVTASFDNNSRNLTFTKGDSSQFSLNIPDVSGSGLPSGVVSGSSQINYPQISNIPSGIVSSSVQVLGGSGVLSGSVSYTTLTNIPAGIVSGSSQIILQSTTGNLSGSRIDGTVALATSASHAIASDTAISASHALLADTALVAGKSQDLYVNCKNTTTAIIPKGAVVRITGASGDNPEIGLADWTNDLNSANTLGITSEAVAVNGFTDVIVQGKVLNLNTNSFTPGQLVFLGASGSIVASVPPQYHEVRLGQVLRANTNVGSLYLSVDNGYELTELHDVNIVTASLANNDLLAYDSASQLWTNKSILGLGIPQLSTNNTFTGTNSFQNISAVSASFQYVQTVTGSAVIIGDAFVVVNNSTPTQPYGGLSVYDSGSVTPTTSSLVWDGDTNDWKYNYNVGTGHDAAVMLFGPAGTGIANTPYPTANKLQKGTGGHHLADSSIYDDGTNVSIGGNVNVTGSIQSNGVSVVTQTDLTPLNNFTASQQITNTALNAFTQSQIDVNTNLNAFTASQQILNAKFATTGSNTFVGNQTISGDLTISGNTNITPASVATNANYIIPFVSGSTLSKDSVDTIFYNPASNVLMVSASAVGVSNIGSAALNITSGSGQYTVYTSTLTKTGYNSTIEGGGYIGLSGNPSKIGAPSLTTSTKPGILALSGSGQPYVAIEFQQSGSTTFTDGGITAKRRFVVEQGLELTGSISTNVNTIVGTTTLDASLGNSFIWNLQDGLTNTLSISNNKIGQTINVQVQQGGLGTGVAAFSATFLQPSGSAYSATQVANATDILTLATFADTSKVYVASVNRFI